MMQADQLTGGWCPHAPVMHTAPEGTILPPETMHSTRPEGSGSTGRIRDGVSLAADSLITIVRDRYLRRFSLLFGLAIFLLIVGTLWEFQYYDHTLPFVTLVPFGDSFTVFNPWLFLAEMIGLSSFNLLLADLILQRDENRAHAPVTIRTGFFTFKAYTGPLTVLSIAMALIATLGFPVVTDIWWPLSNIVAEIMNATFWIPWAYFPYAEVSALVHSSFNLLVINILLLIAALCLVPVIVLKTKGDSPFLAGMIAFMQRTWRQMLGCILLYGTIVLMVAVAAHLIDQFLPMLLPGYESPHRGYPLMMAIYFGFLLACSILLAGGFTAAGVAISDLSRIEKSDGISRVPEENLKKTEAVS